MDRTSRIPVTDSGHTAVAIQHCKRSEESGRQRTGSSKAIYKPAWIIHLDASFKYSRHTISGPTRGSLSCEVPMQNNLSCSCSSIVRYSPLHQSQYYICYIKFVNRFLFV